MTKEILFTEEGQMVGIGAHMCAMHEGVGGVLDTLSRMFLAGLRQNERCAEPTPGALASPATSSSVILTLLRFLNDSFGVSPP